MKPVKVLKIGALVVVLLLIVGGLVVYFYLDHIVKRTIETQATKSLNLQTELGGASLSLFGGKLDLDNLRIASPQGFSAPQMLTLGEADVTVEYGQLDNNPVHVKKITLNKPVLVIEQKDGTFNFKKMADNLSGGARQSPGQPQPPQTPQPQPPQPQPTDPPAPASEAEQMKLIVDELTVQEAVVKVRPNLNIPGVPPEIDIPISTFTLKNVGTGDGSQNGAAVKDVVMQLVTALAAQANTSDALPPELRAIMSGDLSAVANRLGAEAQQRVMAALPGQAGKVLGDVLADPAALTRDPGKAVQAAAQGALQDLVPSTTNPSAEGLQGALPDLGKAAGGFGGLLGGDKDNKEKEDRKDRKKEQGERNNR